MPRPERPRSARPRRPAFVLGGFVLLIAATLQLTATTLRSRTFADVLRRAAVHWGSEFLGADLQIEGLRIQRLQPLRVELAGVSLHSTDPERLGLPLARVHRVEVGLSQDLDLRERRVPIEYLTLDGPQLRIALRGSALRDYQELVDRIVHRPTSAHSLRVELGRLSVLSAEARVDVEPLGLGVAIAGLDLRLEQDANGHGAGRWGASDVEIDWKDLHERATVEPGTFNIRDRHIVLDPHRLLLQPGPLTIVGEVVLPPPPGSRGPPGLRYDLHGDTTIALARLRDVSPRFPEATGEVQLSVHAFGEAMRPQVNFSVRGRDVELPWGKRRRSMKPGSFEIQGYVLSDLLKITPSVFHFGGGQVGLAGRATLRAPYDFEAFLDLDDVRLERVLDAVTVQHSWASLTVRGPARLAGQLQDFGATGNADLQVRDFVLRKDGWDELPLAAEILRIPTVSVDTRLVLGKKHLLLDGATVRTPHGVARASCDFLFQRPVGLVIRAEADHVDLADLDGKIAGIPMDGRGAARATIEGPVNGLEIKGHVDLREGRLFDWPLGNLAGGVHYRSREDLEFVALRGRRGESRFSGQVRVLFPNKKRGGDRATTELELDVDVAQGEARAEDLHGIFFADRVPLQGPAWGRVRLTGPPRALRGSAEVHGQDMVLAGESLASLDASATVEDGTLRFPGAFLRKPSGDGIFLRGSLGPEGLDAELRLLDLALTELDAVPETWQGRLQGDLVLRGRLSAPSLRGRLAVRGLGFRGTTLGDGKLDLQLDDGQGTISGKLLDGRVALDANVRTDGILPYDLRLSWKDLLLDPFLPPSLRSREGEMVTAGITGSLDAEGTLRDDWHEIGLHLDDVHLRSGDRSLHNPALEPVRLRLEDGAWRVDALRVVDGLGTDLQVAGRLRLGGPLLLRAKGPVDLEWLRLVGGPWERVEARHAEILDLELGGTTARPDWSGAVAIEDGLFRVRGFPETLEVATAKLSLRNRRATIESFDGRLGGGRVDGVAGSSITLDDDRWAAQDWRLQARCTACTLHYPSFLPPARGDLALSLTGTGPDGLVLGGRVDIDEMSLRDPINWQRSVLTFRARSTDDLVKEERRPLFKFDLYLSTSPDALRVANNLGDFRGSASDLHLGGDTVRPRITGQIDVSGGTVRYNRHDFRLDPGTAIFRSDKDVFPEVLLSMNSEVESGGESYRVTYALTGPLDRLRFTPSSDPPLPEKDINSLLLFGLTEEQLAQADLGDIAKAAASAGAGTYAGSVAAAGEGETAARVLAPDRVEIVPVYSDTTGSTSVWAVFSKEVLPDLLTLEGGVGLFGSRTTRVNWVSRARLRFARGLYLEGAWHRDDNTSADYGNFSLDMKLELDRP